MKNELRLAVAGGRIAVMFLLLWCAFVLHVQNNMCTDIGL